MLNLEKAKEMIAAAHYSRDAFDVELAHPYVVKYKTPNSHKKEGYTVSHRFFAYAFAVDLAKELGDGWIVIENDQEDTSTAENARLGKGLGKGNARLSIHTKGWGANAYNRLEIHGYVEVPAVLRGQRHHSTAAEIGVSSDKTVAQVAADIRKRVFPKLGETEAAITEAARKEAAKRDDLQRKCDQLARRYSSLKFKASPAEGRIYLETKYGGVLHLSGITIRPNGEKWSLASKEYGVTVNDIDSAPGRAFLALFNSEK